VLPVSCEAIEADASGSKARIGSPIVAIIGDALTVRRPRTAAADDSTTAEG